MADSTLRRDHDLKVPLDRHSGIAEYWILDVQERCLHLFRQPGGEGYGLEQKLYAQDTVIPLAFPDCALAVGDFLRPATRQEP